ncbi:hypothetical protein [Parafrankia sp. EAN1pec]
MARIECMFDLLGVRPRPRTVQDDSVAPGEQFPSQRVADDSRPLSARASSGLPPSVARVAARTRLSAELLAAILTVDGRSRATLDDMERADALADVLLARRRQRVDRHRPELARPARHG